MSAPHAALLMSGGAPAGPTPIFFAPLLTSLVPTIAGAPTATFTRATTAYVSAVAPAGNAVDGEILIQCASGEARFQGARRISSGNWSATYADGSAIPAANLLGYLSEGSVTNLCLQSQTFDSATWAKSNATVTADSAVAPDGTTTADTIAATGALGLVSQTITVAGVPNSFSVYLKRLAGSGTVALVFDGTVTDVTAQINSTTWSRVAALGTPGAGAKVFSIRVSTSGDSVYAWGAQLEQYPNVTSYIPTTSASEVRNTDVLSYALSSNLDSVTGTVYAEFYLVGAFDTQRRYIFRTTDSGFGPMLINTSSLFSCIIPGGGGNDGICTVNLSSKGACTWGSGAMGLCKNGGTVTSNTYSTGDTIGDVQVGASGSATQALNGNLRNVKFYNVKLTNTQLQAITT
jgi:hypothetical protein